MGAVEGVARLESHHIGLARLHKPGSSLSGGEAKVREVVMRRQAEHAERPGDIEAAPPRHLVYERVAAVEGAQHPESLLAGVPGVYPLYGHNSEGVIPGVTQTY